MISREKLPLVSIIISNYNGESYLRECLASLRGLDYPSVEIVLVDAGSTDRSVSIAKSEFPEVRVLEENHIGIGEAINLGIAASQGDLLLIDYNSDEFATPSSLRCLVEVLQSSKTIGAVGGTRLVYGSDGAIEGMGGRFYPFGFYPKIGEGTLYEEVSHDPFDVDYLGHMLVRRGVLQEVGLMDEAFFIYGEDSDFCIRLKKAGYRVVQVPSAVTFHVTSGTVGMETPRYVYYLQRAETRLMLKHCPLPLLPLGLAWTALVTVLVFAVKFPPLRRLLEMTGHKRLSRRGTRDNLEAHLGALHWNLVHFRETLAARRRPRAIIGILRDR